MGQTFLYTLIALGLVAIPALTWFNYRQWMRIKQQKITLEEIKQHQIATRSQLIESIRILALCILEEQVELSEGCIRIKVLLDHLAPELHQEPELQIFSQIHEALAHMPTHEARASTNKRFIFKLDQQRFRLERENKSAILAGAKALRARIFTV